MKIQRPSNYNGKYRKNGSHYGSQHNLETTTCLTKNNVLLKYLKWL